MATAVALVSTMAAGGCSGGSGGGGAGGGGGSGGGGGTASGGSSSGGSNGTGGSPGSGGSAGGCSNVTPCGGNVVGTWAVTSSCLTVSGQLDLSLIGAGCPSAPVTGSLQVTGTLTSQLGRDVLGQHDDVGQRADHVGGLVPGHLIGPRDLRRGGERPRQPGLLLGQLHSQLPAARCSCSTTIQQMGTIGVVSPAPSTSGNYTTSANVVTISGDAGDTNYSYCVSGNTSP